MKKYGAVGLSMLLLLSLLLSSCTVADGVELPEEEAFAQEEILDVEPIPLSAGVPAAEFGVTAPGTLTKSNAKATLDYSNTADGYVMMKYSGTNKKVRTRITGPNGVAYTYYQSLDGGYDVFVLSAGNGSYKVEVFENTTGNKYALALSQTIAVTLKDEFAPFLRSNKYVRFTADSKVATQAAELVKGKTSVNEKIEAVYSYVVNNFTYDYELAKTVTSGYAPNLDDVMTKKKGICFDYAATMAAMLRSQGVPTQLVFGNAGTVYHAWINTYSADTGWVTAAIYFNGKEWKRMDPTFASTGKSTNEIMKYIGDGKNYTEKYLY